MRRSDFKSNLTMIILVTAQISILSACANSFSPTSSSGSNGAFGATNEDDPPNCGNSSGPCPPVETTPAPRPPATPAPTATPLPPALPAPTPAPTATPTPMPTPPPVVCTSNFYNILVGTGYYSQRFAFQDSMIRLVSGQAANVAGTGYTAFISCLADGGFNIRSFAKNYIATTASSTTCSESIHSILDRNGLGVTSNPDYRTNFDNVTIVVPFGERVAVPGKNGWAASIGCHSQLGFTSLTPLPPYQ